MADVVTVIQDNRVVVEVVGADAAAAIATAAVAEMAAQVAADLEEIQEIASGAPDAPSILNKLNKDGDNADAGLLANIGAVASADLGDDTGAGLVGYQRGDTGAIYATAEVKFQDWLNAESDFGVVSTGTTPSNQSPALQAAINAGSGSAYKRLILPTGPIWLGAPINMTNRFGGGISLEGANGTTIPNTLNGTTFICNTGGVAFDMTGSQNITFKDISADSVTLSPATPSEILFLQARSTTSQYAQFNVFENVIARTHTDIAANGGTGTYGFLNIAAEIASYRDIWSISDNPFAMYGQKPAWVSSPFQTIETGIISLSVIDFGGCTTFTGLNATRPLFKAQLAKGVSFANYHAAGVYDVTMDMDGCDGVTVHSGRVEGSSQIIAALNNCTNIYLTTDTTGGAPSCAIRMGANFNANRNIHLRTNYRPTWGFVVDSANSGSILRQLMLALSDDTGTVVTTNFPTVSSVVRLLESGGFTGLSLTNPNVSGALFNGGTQVVGARGAAVTAPTGGATIDAESRTAINAILARMVAHGLIS